MILQLLFVFNCFGQFSEDFNRTSLESGGINWNQGFSSGMTGEFLIVNNELQAVFDDGSGTRKAYISTAITPDLGSYTINWKGKIKLDFTSLSSSLVSKNYCRYYLMSDKENLSDTPYGYFLEFKLVPNEDSLTCKLVFESEAGKTELPFENPVIKFKAQEYLGFEVLRNPDGAWKYWVNDHFFGLINFPNLASVHSTGLQINYSSGAREDKFFMDDLSLNYHPYFDSLAIIGPSELEFFGDIVLDSASVFEFDNYTLNDSISPGLVSFDPDFPQKIRLEFSEEFIPDQLNTILLKGIRDTTGNEIPADNPQFLTFTYSQPDLSPPEILEITGIEKNQIAVRFDETIAFDSASLGAVFKIVETENQAVHFQADTLDDKIIKLTFQKDLEVGNAYTLQANQIVDLEGNVQNGQEFTFVFSDNLAPDLEYVSVLSGKSMKLSFSEPLGETQVNQTTNFKLIDSGINPVLSIINQDNPKEVLLYFNQKFDENKPVEIGVSKLEDIYGNQIENMVSRSFIYDTKKPSINTSGSIIPIDENHIKLHFTEALTLESAAILNNYEIKGNIGFPAVAMRDSTDFSVVHLFYEKPIEQEKEHEITIRNVSDLAGNVISTKTRKFIFDQKPPFIEEICIFSKQHLKLFFSEPLLISSANQPEHYYIDAGVGNPDSIFISPYNTSVAHLFFENEFPEQDSILLVTEHLEDGFGNILPKPDSIFLNTDLPSLAELVVVSDKTLLMRFSEKIGNHNLSVVTNPVIGPSKKLSYHNADSSVLMVEFLASFEADSSYTLKLENISDLSGNTSPLTKAAFVFNPIVKEVKVAEANLVNLYFEEELHPDFQFNNADFKIIDYGMVPLSVVLDQENHDFLSLVFQDEFPADTNLKLCVPPILKKNGEMAPETNIEFIYDLKPPKVASIKAIKNEITIIFSEPVDKISASALNHYMVNEEVGHPIDFEFNNDTLVSFYFESDFEIKKPYFLEIEQVEDLAGNSILDTSITFKIYPNPKLNQLLITELMADPSPSIGLPETEYIEIWNVSKDTFNLAGMKLADGTGETSFPNFIICPNEYLILCGSNHSSQFTSFGKTLALPSFPSLNNSGEILKLLTGENELINEVNYQVDWYGNDEKSDGGWSLEIIDPFNFCNENGNWKASDNSLGGTPGRINSGITSNPDTVAPQLDHWEVLSDSTLQIVFSERMDTSALLKKENYLCPDEIDFGLNISADRKSVEMVFFSHLEKGKRYEMSIQNLSDQCGNLSKDISINLIVPELPAYHEIIVTEIFADPSPTAGLPEYEYLELYNPTDKTFDLGDLRLKVGEDELKINTSLLLPNEYVILTSTSGEQWFDKFGRTIGLTNWVSLKNTGDQIILRNKKGELLFEITYEDEWYYDPEKEDGGFALEMKNVKQPCLAKENWEASKSEVGGTPGKENSWKEAQIRDDFPPKLQKGFANDDLSIQLIFDGKLDSLSAVNAVIKIAPETGVKKQVFDYHYQNELRLELENPLEEKVQYKISIKDLQDCSGNTNIEWQTLDLVLPEKSDSADVLISEILFNPPVGGIDFVEIYNPSGKHIDLKNWRLGNAKTEEIISEKPLILAPYTFLTFSSDIDQLKSQHSNGEYATFFELKLPSFNDEEGSVILKNESGNIMDEFSYHEDFHNTMLDDKNGVSLERIDYAQPTQSNENWMSAAEPSGFATPGYKNSQYNDHQFAVSEECFEVFPKVIVPDLDGIDDYTVLHYNCIASGSLATIKIYDAFGKSVKNIVNNQLISVDGQFIWDGTNDLGEKVNMGNYIIQIILVEANGNQLEFRENVAVGTRF
ncbi:lamin tail domain-containing protein [Flexithrix dorotheae]|uniref:lamin tail domain-containing protein n=1 Tax=Flexithrix dorotheae TaxID=70993 RepID=UPI00146F58C0|nr:lamin tail domain-containing protein [Flexithrix dorotheae]